MRPPPNYQLYLVTDPNVLGEQSLVTGVEQAIAGGVTLVQLREKHLDSKAFFEQALSLKKLCHAHDIPLIINDRVDIALAVDADGVHIGQDDLPANVVRRLIGEDKILGVTAKTVEQAQLAEQNGADYLGVGAVFGTTTKADAKAITLDDLKAICQSVKIPVVAIGGITADNVLQLQGSGVAGVAVVSGILGQADIRGASENLRAKVITLQNLIAEDDYIKTLEKERLAFAWVLENFGAYTAKQAQQEALKFYYYEPPKEELRDLVFHELSWHWAMLHLYGEEYWQNHPELQQPSEAYYVFYDFIEEK